MIQINLLKNASDLRREERLRKEREYRRYWRNKNLGKVREYNRQWRNKNPAKEWERWLQRKYGLATSQYDAMALAQKGLCQICGKPPAGKRPRLCVDHDHETGAVRGLLCVLCNSGIGKLGDSPERLEAAAKYLREAKAQNIFAS